MSFLKSIPEFNVDKKRQLMQTLIRKITVKEMNTENFIEISTKQR